MFNLFGSPNRQEKISNYPAVVEEIHNEFFTAGDRLLQEANEILAAASAASIEKGKRLAALGFNNVPEAVNAQKVEKQIEMSKEVAELVRYYQIKYPNNKFITEEQVKAICEKYGLVCGEISMYKGFVPESKLKVIESFKFDITDSEVVYSYGLRFFTKKELFEDSDAFGKSWRYNDNKKVYDKLFSIKGVGTEGHIKSKYNNEGFKICAPLKDMEIPKGKEVRGYKIQDIPDPVVLQPVNGGYLIVAAWGDEASDEIVVNQTQN